MAITKRKKLTHTAAFKMRDKTKAATYTAAFDRHTFLWTVIDNKTEEIVAYIPNGKTKIPRAVGECSHCRAVDRKFANKISRGLNGAKVTLKEDTNACDGMLRLL